jgi:uncharacterized protein involved in outer membrane biogenesis
MVSLGHLRISIDMPSLFDDVPVIPSLLIENCDIRLVENDAGEANWDVLPQSEAGAEPDPEHTAGPPVVLLDARIHDCRVQHDAPERKQALVVAVDEFALQLVEGDHWQGSGAGRVDGETLSFAGRLAPVGALLRGEPLQYDVSLHVGDDLLQSSGSIEEPHVGRGADLTVRFTGPDMAVVLDRLELPALSEGAFDFRLTLDSEDSFTELSVDGDLGNLMLDASGQLDRLVKPQTGAVRLALNGPNLQALGEALGAEGLVPDAFDLQGAVSFDNGVARTESLVLQTGMDRLELSGVLGRPPRFADSNLTIHASTSEIGRWRERVGLHAATVGPATLSGELTSDAGGIFSARQDLTYVDSTISINGKLGAAEGLLQPDVAFTIESADAAALAVRLGIDRLSAAPLSAKGRVTVAESMLRLHRVQATFGDLTAAVNGVINPASPFTGSDVELSVEGPNAAELGRLLGREDLPVAAFAVQGKISRPDQRLHFEGLDLDLAGHRVRIDGYLNPDPGFSGSNFNVRVDSPDVAALAALFGTGDLPHEAMKLSMTLKQDGEGLAFRTSEGSVGEITLDIDGRIADLDKPLGIDAHFDIRLPSLALLSFLAPDAKWPDLPLRAHGRIQNGQTLARLQEVQLALGTFEADVSGDLYPDRRFALMVEARGPDASQLEPWVGRPLQPRPFTVQAHVAGTPSAFEISDLDARLGASELTGALQVSLEEPRSLEGRLQSPYLDFTHLNAERTGVEAASRAPPSDFVFDDTPVFTLKDLGIDIDLRLDVAELDLGNTHILDIELGFSLSGGRLQLEPMAMKGGGGGSVVGSLVLDAGGAAPDLRLELMAENVRLGLAAAEGQDLDSIPPSEIHVLLEGKGETRRQMASNLNGKVRIYTGGGLVAASGIDFLLNDFLTELFTTLNPFAKKSEYTTLDCSVWAATIVDGQVEVFPVVVQTEELTILTQGAIDLHTEKIDLSFSTKPRTGIGISAGILINPLIKVRGRLVAPAVELDPAGAAVSSGLAVATAGISLLAKSMSDRFLSSKDPCGDARKEIDNRDP